MCGVHRTMTVNAWHGHGTPKPNRQPSKHAGSDHEAFWLWPVMCSMQPESGQIVYMPDPASHIHFKFNFSKEGMDLTVQN